MATSPNIINLSALPVPDAVQVPDPSAIFSQWLIRLRELDPDFDALVESDPVFKQGEINAYQITLLLQRVNDAVRAVFLASAKGNDLDQIGAGFNVARLIITPAEPDAVPPVDAVMENDDAYRERIQLSWSQLNTAGSRNAYRFHAKSADPDVLDAEGYGPKTHNRPGEVDVYVLSRTGDGTASAALIAKVSGALSEDEKRPLTDYVQVKSATLTRFETEADLEIPDGPDAETVFNNAKETYANYLALAKRIGGVVPLSAIYAALQQSGVTRVRLTKPVADIERAMGAAPFCAAPTLTRSTGSNADV
ncbi:baseplate J/gp47 family protein [Serratia liquefaciens]|uniref:baseplate assembly protein n=1 Tax=Serratia liquefaciens TaxID=614 RepID=UPI0018E49EF4|nr:baseplate J/gp47 family protein [Serratia liquefaciens]MBI6162480.1 baseplate J/gp47 family protein [Serratia liquefaciens]